MADSDFGRITGIDEEDYGYEPERRPGKSHAALWITLLVIVIAALVTGGVYYFLKQKKQTETGLSRLSDFEKIEQIDERKKNPDNLPDDIDLLKAVNMYRQGYIEPAKNAFHDITESGKPEDVKSLAFTYLGIISDDEGRFNLAIDFFRRAIKFKPDNFHAHYNLAIALRHRGMYKEALEELEKARALRPGQISASITKGEIQYEQKNYDDALKTFEEIYKEDKNPHAIYNMGIIYKKTGRMAEAKSAFLDALNRAGAGEVAWKAASQLGILHATQGDLENAKYYFETAIRLAPSNGRYHYNLALVLHQMNDIDQAVFHLQRAVELGDKNPDTYTYIARLYGEIGKTEAAALTLEAALKEYPRHIGLQKQYADTLVKEGKYADAIDILKKLYEATPSSAEKAEILYNLGQAYQELKEWEQAIQALEMARSLNPGYEEILIALADAYSENGENHKAIALYREATKVNPDNIALLKAQGRMFVEQGLMAEAENTFERLIKHPMKKESDVYYAYRYLGDINRKRNNCDAALEYYAKLENAPAGNLTYEALLSSVECMLALNKPSMLVLSKVEKAISIRPQEAMPRILLGRALIRQGTAEALERASDELTLVVESGNADPVLISQALTLRGIVWYKDGVYNRALDDFNRALELHPGNNEAFQNRRAAMARLEESY